MSKAIIYGRVSTDEQAESGTSLDNQEARSLAYLKAKGLSLVAEPFREDFTGTVLERPELTKVRGLLRSGQADTLVVYKTDRLDRSEWGVNLLILLQELKTLGVELHYSETGRQVNLDNPQEMLLESIKGWQAGEDRKAVVKRLAEGRMMRAKQGSVICFGRFPFGYILVKREKIYRLEVDPSEAEIVRLIFHWYVVDGLSMHAVAERLNDMGVLTPRSIKAKQKGWLQTTIRRILTNETYAGRWYYGKKNFRGAGYNPRENWVAVDVPAIIDRGTWEAAQEMIEQNKQTSRRNQKHPYLMGRLLYCGDCGYKITSLCTYNRGKYPYLFYHCQSSTSDQRIHRGCTLPRFSARVVDEVVFSWLADILTNQEKLQQAVADYLAEREEYLREYRQRVGNYDNLIAEQTDQLEKAVRQLAKLDSGGVAETILLADIQRAEGLLGTLKAKREEANKELWRHELDQDLGKTLRGYKDASGTPIPHDPGFVVFEGNAYAVSGGKTTPLLAVEKYGGAITLYTSVDAMRLRQQEVGEARQDFGKRRKLIEKYGVSGTLLVKDGQRFIKIKAKLGEAMLPVEFSTTNGDENQEQI